MRFLHIGPKKIGAGHPVFIIAEAGVNHNGRLDLALKLVDIAKECGADAVKFQNFKPEEVVTSKAPMAEYQKKNIGKNESQVDMIRGFALISEDFKTIAAHCKKRGIMFLSTPHSGFGSVDLLKELNVPAYKFGSGDLTNIPTLAYAARHKKPMIIATGMANMQEIGEAISTIKKAGNNKIIVLQCTTDYPTEKDEVNVRVMPEIARKFKVEVGFSDHTRDSQAAITAVTLGASVVEKHFTLDKNMTGPDHKASADPAELADYIRRLRDVETILGTSKKAPTRSEKHYMAIVRKSVVARHAIRKGERFTEKNLAIKRPGTGLHPRTYLKLLGKKAKRNIAADEILKQGDV